MKIGTHEIGIGYPCFVIAEAGVNHNGSLDLARQLVDAAAAAGADAVKFQTFKTEHLVTVTAPQAAYQSQNMGRTETQFEMLKALELSAEDYKTLSDYCASKGILFLSTPFDPSSADLLHELGVPAIKLGSSEVTNLPFLGYVAKKQKPIILSTGMSTLADVDNALSAIYAASSTPVVLLHCTSNYPTPPDEVNLRAMETLAAAFGIPVGYSDHTEGIDIPIAAAARGAVIIEKHFTLDRTLPGPDHKASLEPAELGEMVRSIRRIESALGTGIKKPTASELETAKAARRSLVAAKDITAGTQITGEHLTAKRPGTGLPPSFQDFLLGKTARQDISKDTLLGLELFA